MWIDIQKVFGPDLPAEAYEFIVEDTDPTSKGGK